MVQKIDTIKFFTLLDIYLSSNVKIARFLDRYTNEINDILENQDIVRFIKVRRIQWYGHILRMNESQMPWQVMNAKVYNARRRGRPKI